MDLPDLLLAGLHSHGAEVFGEALFVFGAKVLLRRTTKQHLLSAAATEARRGDPTFEEEQRAALFECQRVGIELTVVAFVALLATLRLANKLASAPTVRDLAADLIMPTGALLLFLVVVATYLTATYNSAKGTYKKGLYLPNAVGILAVITVAALFHGLMRKVA